VPVTVSLVWSVFGHILGLRLLWRQAARSKIPTRSPYRSLIALGNTPADWSGEQPWIKVSHPVSKARTPLSGAMKKDKSKAVGEDAA